MFADQLFGLLQGRDFSAVGAGAVISATYASALYTFNAAGCAVTVNHTQIVCSSSVGVGTALHWLVTVAGRQSAAPSTDAVSYFPPLIQRVVFTPGLMHTAGGETVVLYGTNLGCPTYLPHALYGAAGYATPSCQTVNYTTAICTTVNGVGVQHHFRIVVGSQTSPASADAYSYRRELFSVSMREKSCSVDALHSARDHRPAA